METAIIFLAKAIASGAAGHYIKKALDKIDSELGELFASGASVDRIEEAIEKKQVAEQVNEVFKESVDTSIIFASPEGAATLDDVVEMIASIVSICFEVASKENIDLVLPGSPISADSISVFGGGANQKVEVSDRRVHWKAYVAKLHIMSMENVKRDAYWNDYLSKLRRLRKESKNSQLKIGYSLPKPEGFGPEFEVVSLTAGSARFETNSILVVRSEEYVDWNSGILAMLEGLRRINDLKYLPVEDLTKLKNIATKLHELTS